MSDWPSPGKSRFASMGGWEAWCHSRMRYSEPFRNSRKSREGTELMEELVYSRPEALADVFTHYCPGCTHGIAHRLVAGGIGELEISAKTIGGGPVRGGGVARQYFKLSSA